MQFLTDIKEFSTFSLLKPYVLRKRNIRFCREKYKAPTWKTQMKQMRIFISTRDFDNFNKHFTGRPE